MEGLHLGIVAAAAERVRDSHLVAQEELPSPRVPREHRIAIAMDDDAPRRWRRSGAARPAHAAEAVSASVLSACAPSIRRTRRLRSRGNRRRLARSARRGLPRYRIRSIEYLGEKLLDAGIPILTPTGGHALYLDAQRWLSHIPQAEFPAWALSLVLYLEGGIRAAEIDSVMFARQPDGSERPAELELVRLAFPRRVYTQSHVDYVAEVLLHVATLAHRIRGVRMLDGPPVLRHFTAHFAPANETLVAR